MPLYKLLLVVYLFLKVHTLFGQNLNTFGLSNSSGIYAVLVNPALGIESINCLSINAIGAGINSESNNLRLLFNDPLVQNLTLKFYRDGYNLIEIPYAEYTGKKNSRIFVQGQALLPSILWNINPNISVFAYVRERAYGSAYTGSDMSRLYLHDKIDQKDSKRNFTLDRRDLQYNEMALGSSLVLHNKREMFLAFGYTVKKLSARKINFQKSNEISYVENDNTVTVNMDYQVVSTNSKVLTKDMIAHLLLQNAPGRGYGFDFGFVFELRPYHLRNTYSVNNPKGKNKSLQQREKTKYLFKAHLGINDIGRINFKGDNVIFDRHYESQARIKIDSLIGTQDAIKFFNNPSPTTLSTITSETNELDVFTSASLNIGCDFRLADRIFVHTLLTKGFQNSNSRYTPIVPFSISGLFRKEWNKFMLGIPYRIVPISQTYSFGFLAKAGPLFFGTDNLSSLFLSRVKNFSAYGGIVFNIRCHKSAHITECPPF